MGDPDDDPTDGSDTTDITDGSDTTTPTDGAASTDDPECLDGPFLLDAMLGTLATYLRMCGYDAAYALDDDRATEADDELLRSARAEGRTLLTRDVALAAWAGDRGYLLEAREVEDQLRTLREAGLALELPARPTRCGSCNGPLEPFPAGAARPDHAPADRRLWHCRDCGQPFWKGSHWERVRETLAGL
jgi:uncharacterized protein with PIN domain